MNAAAEEDTTQASAETEAATKRLTLQITPSMHKAVKNGATDRETTILSVTTEMYRARFMGADWPQDVVDQVLAQLVRQADAGAFQWPAAVASSVRGQGDKPARAKK